jgi:hypothetical protein
MAEAHTVVTPTGEATITTIGLLEDFWFDFLNFQRDVRVATRANNLPKAKRFLRAGLFSFVNYVSGLVDRWSGQAGLPAGAPAAIGTVRPTIVDRLMGLCQGDVIPDLPSEELGFLEALARRCANLLPSDEAQLFEDLAVEKIEFAEIRVFDWIRDFARRKALALHADARAIGLSYASSLGEVRQESYRGFEVLGDDYQSLHDDLEGWGPADEGLERADD